MRYITKRIQLIYDGDTQDYLNYRQLIRDPKHKEIWAQSSANEFGRLTQGLKDGRVKGMNTMRYITKRIQLIYDGDTQDYLNYRQLIRDPYHKESNSKGQTKGCDLRKLHL
jgi:hypothetical protein